MPLPKLNPGDPLRAADIRAIALAIEANTLKPGKGYSLRRGPSGVTIVFSPTRQFVGESGESDSGSTLTPDAGTVPRAGETKTISVTPDGKLFLYSSDTNIPTGELKAANGVLKSDAFIGFIENDTLKWARASELAAPPPAWRWGRVGTQGSPGEPSYGIYQWKEVLALPVTNPPTYQEVAAPDHLVLALTYHSGQHS